MAGGGIPSAGGVFEQFAIWGVLMQIAQAILSPVMVAINQQVFSGMTSVALSPQQAADLVLKGWWDMDAGIAEANKYGINTDRFTQMVNDAGEPPGLDQVIEGFRRGFISWSGDSEGGLSVLQGIKESRLRDEWASLIQQLVTEVIPVGDAVSAVLRHQIPQATGEQIAFYSGISADDFQVLLNTAGNPPGPSELIDWVRRGFIPISGSGPDALTLEQGIYEGDAKDKWFPLYVQSLVYLPPPRTITALERAGVITTTQAQQLYAQQGLDPQLAAAYSQDASAVKLVKNKELAEGTVLDLYKGGVIPESEASTLLGTLGYTAEESAWILSWTDLRREIATLEKAITKVGTLYIARKIGETSAIAALGELGLPAAQQEALLELWTLERDASVKVLTPSEVADAFKYAVVDQATAQAMLESLGYDAFDAWVLLGVANLAPVPNPPAVTENPTGQAP